MLIKQIALKNFRQYKDLQVVEFSCDKEKNGQFCCCLNLFVH